MSIVPLLHALSDLSASDCKPTAIRNVRQLLRADQLMIFIPDPELDAFLPAPGFPGLLPDGFRWQEFCRATVKQGSTHESLLSPFDGGKVHFYGRAGRDRSVVACNGQDLDHHQLELLLNALPLVSTGFRSEWSRIRAEAEAKTLKLTSDRASLLAAQLDLARRRLQDALIQSSDALKLRDEFLSVAAHELRTPITSLLLELQFLERTLHRDSIPSPHGVLGDGLRTLIDQTSQLGKLVDRLLDVSRMTTDSVQLETSPCDLVALVKKLAKRFAQQALSVGSTIEVWADAGVQVSCDPLKVEQAIGNLLINAIKYGLGKPISIRVTNREHHVSVSITDQGMGIDPVDQERIFGRYERAVHFRKISGMGLGLYITRRIAEAHGGRIGIDSRPGVGSTFSFHFPWGNSA